MTWQPKPGNASGLNRTSGKSDGGTDSQVPLPATVKVATDPTFDYIVPKSNRYVLLLDRTSRMEVNGRWTTVKRAFFRFINNLPVGSELSIISFDSHEAVVNLPPTVVTDSNREGLHGRIPRKVDHGGKAKAKAAANPQSDQKKTLVFPPTQGPSKNDDDIGCTFCALNASLNQALVNYVGETDPGIIVLVTGSPVRPAHLDRVLRAVEDTPVQVFPVLYPSSTAHPDLASLGSAGGGVAYAVPEDADSWGVSAQTYMTEVLLDVLRRTESGAGIRIQKVHETRHLSYEFAGTFTMENDILHEMSVTLRYDHYSSFHLLAFAKRHSEEHVTK